jgi:hypothetical protein
MVSLPEREDFFESDLMIDIQHAEVSAVKLLQHSCPLFLNRWARKTEDGHG